MSSQCPFCSAKTIHSKWRELGYSKCASCGLYFRNPMPTPQELDNLYNRVWSDTTKPRVGMGGTNERLSGVYTRELINTLGRQDLQNLKILDYGAGRGDFSRAMKQKGAEMICLEPFGYDYLVKEGFTVYKELNELKIVEELDGIVMVDVWEHLTEPWKIMEACGKLLRPGGWLFIATANPLGLNARLRGSRWREARKPSHLLFPEPRTLEKMYKNAGFTKWQHLKWPIKYSDRILTAALHYLLQRTGLDGELRYIAWK